MTSSRSIRDYRDLVVWRRGIELAGKVYQLTGKFPAHERFGLVSQMRRAAVSVPANIAEGRTRQYRKEFRQFLFMALGSLAELDTERVVATNLGYLPKPASSALEETLRELRKMIGTLANRLAKSPTASSAKRKV